LVVLWVALPAIAVLACASPAQRPESATPDARPGATASTAPVLVSTTGDSVPLEHATTYVPVTEDDPAWGHPLAPVTIVEFGDFECPFSSRVNATLDKIRLTYGPSKVRLVWKHYPLPFHRNARAAADAAHSVFELGGPNAFFKFHDQAFGNQHGLTAENYETWANIAGVDAGRFRALVASKNAAGKVDDDIALARRLGINGTPVFCINGVMVNGAQPFEKFQEVIDSELVEAKTLLDSGTRREDVYVLRTGRNFKEVPPAPPTSPTNPDDDLAVWKIPVLPDDPVRGPKDALVTIVQFSDFQCPFCERVEKTLDQVMSAHPKDVRIVWKDNPLPFHPRARPSAILARNVFEKRGNEAFWKVHEALFASLPKLEDVDLKRIAEDAGLAWNPIALAIEKNHAPKVDSNMDLAVDFKARGTPHFFINGVRLAGAQPREKFEERVTAALEAARALVAGGVPRSKVYETTIANGTLPEPPEQKTIPRPDATTPFRGNAAAPVVIQEFGDFQCPFTKRVTPTLAEVEATFGKKVKLVWRHMPLPFHKDAFLAAEAAQEAFAQKGNVGFWRFHDALFEAQETGIGRDVLESIAERLGLDMRRFRGALDSHVHRKKVEADAKIAENAGISGTPGFVINGYFVSGAQPAVVFQKAIRRALAP
jgi:protein-disulfide isomerase